MRIRDATVDDADAVAVVHVHGWRWGYRGLLPEDFLNGLSAERRAEQWRSWLLEPGRTRIRLAEEDGACAGFAVSGPSRDPGADEDTGEVYAIYLEERFAGTGLGTDLLRSAVGWLAAQGFARATLWVLEGNARARRFYEREGWTPDGSEKSEPREDFTMDEIRYAIAL